MSGTYFCWKRPFLSFCGSGVTKMVQYCVAYGCKEAFKKGSPVSFHSFPTDEELKNMWILSLKRVNFHPSKYSRLCSNHFAPECFDMEAFGKGRKLKKGSVPSIFNFPEHLNKLGKKRKSPEESFKMSGNWVTICYEEPTPEEFVKEEQISDPGRDMSGFEGDTCANQHHGEDTDQFERLNNDSVAVKMERKVKEENISDQKEYMAASEGDMSANQHQGEITDQFEGLNSDTITVCCVKMEKMEEEEEMHPFEAVFLSLEDDICVSESDAVDPLAMGKEDGSENAIVFERNIEA